MAQLDGALAVARGIGDDSLAARALSMLTGLSIMVGDWSVETQLPLLEEAVDLARRSGDHALGQALNGLGIITSTFDPERARDLFTAGARSAFEVETAKRRALRVNLVSANPSLRGLPKPLTGRGQIIPIMQRLGDTRLEAVAPMLHAQARVASGESAAARDAIARALGFLSSGIASSTPPTVTALATTVA